MGDILPFKKPVAKSKGMCTHGFHKFKPDNSRRFDVKTGKLVTRLVCERCGLEKVTTI